jgi:hypothetical protein
VKFRLAGLVEIVGRAAAVTVSVTATVLGLFEAVADEIETVPV